MTAVKQQPKAHATAQSSPPASRYDRRFHNTRMLGLAKAPRSRNTDTVTAAVIDPMGDGKERLFATINRRVDILETERSHERISESAYQTGRLAQAVFEQLGKIGGSNWQGGSRVDVTVAQEQHIIKSLDHARQIQALYRRMCDRLGMIDARLLRRILGDRMGFAECAALQGKTGERGTTYIAMRFREALEELTEAWSAKGQGSPAPADKYSEEAARREATARATAEASEGGAT